MMYLRDLAPSKQGTDLNKTISFSLTCGDGKGDAAYLAKFSEVVSNCPLSTTQK